MSLNHNSSASSFSGDQPVPSGWSDTDQEVLLKLASIENTIHLIEALKSADKDTSGRMQYKFQFMQLTGLAIPEIVRELQDTGFIDLTMTREQGQPIDFSLEFHSDSGGHTLMTSRSAETDPASTVDLSVFPTNTTINPDNIRTFPISAADINRLIMSMVEPKADGRYDNATAYNLHDPDMLIPFETVLGERSDSYDVNAVYYDLDDRGLSLTYTGSTNFESKTTSFTVVCPTNLDGSRRIVMQADLEPNLEIIYYEDIETNSGLERCPLIPDAEDLIQINQRTARTLERFQIKFLSIEDPQVSDEADIGDVIS